MDLVIKQREGLYGFDYREEDGRRVDPNERKVYNIKQLWQRNHEIVNLSAMGWKDSDIAEILNITVATVSNTLNSDLGKAKLAEVRFGRDEEAKKTTERIRVLTNKALDTYDEIFSAEDETIPLKDRGKFAESFIKDVSGLRAPIRVDQRSLHVSMTKESLDAIKQRGIDAMREAGLLAEEQPV
jgi:predicted transcriptional regulator